MAETLAKWWLPNETLGQLPGLIVEREDDRLEIEIAGLLGPFDGSDGDFVDRREQTIFGRSPSGVPYTICDAYQVGATTHDNFDSGEQWITVKIRPEVAFYGVHVPSGSATKWAQLHVEFTGLAEWLKGSAISWLGDSRRGYEAIREDPWHLSLRGAQCEIRRGVAERRTTTEASLSESAVVTFKPVEPGTFWTVWNNWAGRCASFLAFISEGRIMPSKIWVSEGYEHVESYRVMGTGMVKQPLDPSAIRPDGFLLRHITLDGRAMDCAVAWIDEEFRTAMDIIVSLKTDPPRFGEVHFLTLMSAVEAFHRAHMDHEDVPSEEHRDRCKAVLEHLPSSFAHKQWVSTRLMGNEPTFKQRLSEMLDSAAEVVGPMLGDQGQFVSRVGNTRNYLVHQKPEFRKSAETDPERLYWMTEVVGICVDANILRHLGLDMDAVRREMWSNRRCASTKEHLIQKPLFRSG